MAKIKKRFSLANAELATKGTKREGLLYLQRYLVQFGYLEKTGYAENVLDDATSAALARYQKFHRLKASGEFDPATREIMAIGRCMLPDPAFSELAFSTRCAWNKKMLRFKFDTMTSDTAGEAEAVRKAMMSWSSVVDVTFIEAADDLDIDVDWRPAADPDHSMVGTVLAHADFPPDCSVVTTSRPKPLHFDDSENTWCVGAVSGEYDVETVALHELGHLLGLQHSGVSGSVMWPSVSDNFTRHALTNDDIQGAQALYSAVSVQSDWRWCSKCQGLHFGGHNINSNCPAGGTHSVAGSGNYRIHHSSSAAPGQADWRWCSKCQGMHFGTNVAQSDCPEGGTHSTAGSGNYKLLNNVAGAVGQHSWRWCSKCQGLWFAGNNTAGVCKAGGGHSSAGSGDYRLMYL